MQTSSDVVFRLGDRLLVGKNNYVTFCFNGETGEIVGIGPASLTQRTEDQSRRQTGTPAHVLLVGAWDFLAASSRACPTLDLKCCPLVRVDDIHCSTLSSLRSPNVK